MPATSDSIPLIGKYERTINPVGVALMINHLFIVYM